MTKGSIVGLVCVGAMSLMSAPVWAADEERVQQGAQQELQQQEQIFGRQLMTPEERAEYRGKIRSLKTEEERRAFRLEHHKRMEARAQERGMTIPDMPPAMGGGMGPGRQMGPGMGQQGERGR